MTTTPNALRPAASGRWLRRFLSTPAPALRLICFPHAGGSPSWYRGWPKHLPRDIELLAACYPGRQDRLDEPCLHEMDRLVPPLVEAIAPLAHEPFAFFGHSMGAAVAYEVTLQLQQRLGVTPAVVFSSALEAPHLLERDPLHLGGDAAIEADVHRNGDVSAQVLADPELRELVMPALRADYELICTYGPRPRRRIDAPVVTYAGDTDTKVSAEALAGWGELTTAWHDSRTFTGGHFYLAEHEADLVHDVVGHLADRTGAGRVPAAA